MAERLELIKTVDKIHLCSSILSSHSSLTGAKTIKIQIKMKQNFKLFAALAASAAMMFSCQQAEDPTMDAVTPSPTTRLRPNNSSEMYFVDLFRIG